MHAEDRLTALIKRYEEKVEELQFLIEYAKLEQERYELEFHLFIKGRLDLSDLYNFREGDRVVLRLQGAKTEFVVNQGSVTLLRYHP